MTALEKLARLEAALVGRARLLGAAGLPAHAKLALRMEEVWASCALAGSALTLSQTRALLQRGVVAGDRAFRDYLVVWGYGSAAAWVGGHGLRRSGEPLIALPELRELHARATGGVALVESRAKPGAWRTANAPQQRAAMVPAGTALVVSEMAALLDRLGHGPPAQTPLFVWIADIHERLERIRPFPSANGRVARLAVNLVLTRLGLPPAAIVPRYARAYRAALSDADAGNPLPLAFLLARSVERALGRALAPGDLRPLAEHAGELSLAALRKAAVRGRLRHVYVGGRLYTTRAWCDDYRASCAYVSATSRS